MDFKFYINTILEFLPNLISAIFILLGFLISGRILNKIITKKIKSDNPVIMNFSGKALKRWFYGDVIYMQIFIFNSFY